MEQAEERLIRMKVLHGISDGMVMQRGADGCDIRFTAEYNGRIAVSVGRLEKMNNGMLRLTGVPVGGPYSLTLSDVDGKCMFCDIYVGDVWILAGQSNMEGAGQRREKEIEYDKNPRQDVRAYYLDDRWKPAGTRLHQQWLNTDPGVREKYLCDNFYYLKFYDDFDIETASGVGPGHFIGLKLRELSGVPQGLIPCAYGGSNMRDWTPDNTTPESLYLSMVRRFVDCGSHVRGVFWYQGEGETSQDGVAKFNGNMKRMVEQMRIDFCAPKLPFVQAQIGRCNLPQTSNEEASEGWMQVKELQRKMVEWLPYTATVSNANSFLQDLIHIDAQSQEELGGWMAEEMHRLITGKGEEMPKLTSIRRYHHPTRHNFDIIELTFAHVIGELKCFGRPYGFSITLDDEKPYQYPYRYIDTILLDGDKVLIYIESDYVKAGHEYIWYSAGFACVCTIIDGAGRPLMAFGPIKV
jgi:hypothetical protein